MNTFMYTHPVTKKHLTMLQEDWPYVTVLKPVEKVLVCGDIGMGGMRDWHDIVVILTKKINEIRGDLVGADADDEDEDTANEEEDDDEEGDTNLPDETDSEDSGLDDEEDEDDDDENEQKVQESSAPEAGLRDFVGAVGDLPEQGREELLLRSGI